MALPFEFVIEDRPVSQQTKRGHRLREWTQRVRKEAEQHWEAGDLPDSGPVMLSITYFYDEVDMDVDNIPKPISDALNELAYKDDNQVSDLLCRKRNLNYDLRIQDPSPILARAFLRREHFVHILVEEAPDQEVIY